MHVLSIRRVAVTLALLTVSGLGIALAGAPALAAAAPGPAPAARANPATVPCTFYSGTGESKRGDTNVNRVKEVQCLLNFWGYGVTVDGSFGSKTEAAVKQFQTDDNTFCRIKLLVDGKVGTHTWSALRNDVGLGCPTV